MARFRILDRQRERYASRQEKLVLSQIVEIIKENHDVGLALIEALLHVKARIKVTKSSIPNRPAIGVRVQEILQTKVDAKCLLGTRAIRLYVSHLDMKKDSSSPSCITKIAKERIFGQVTTTHTPSIVRFSQDYFCSEGQDAFPPVSVQHTPELSARINKDVAPPVSLMARRRLVSNKPTLDLHFTLPSPPAIVFDHSSTTVELGRMWSNQSSFSISPSKLPSPPGESVPSTRLDQMFFELASPPEMELNSLEKSGVEIYERVHNNESSLNKTISLTPLSISKLSPALASATSVPITPVDQVFQAPNHPPKLPRRPTVAKLDSRSRSQIPIRMTAPRCVLSPRQPGLPGARSSSLCGVPSPSIIIEKSQSITQKTFAPFQDPEQISRLTVPQDPQRKPKSNSAVLFSLSKKTGFGMNSGSDKKGLRSPLLELTNAPLQPLAPPYPVSGAFSLPHRTAPVPQINGTSSPSAHVPVQSLPIGTPSYFSVRSYFG